MTSGTYITRLKQNKYLYAQSTLVSKVGPLYLNVLTGPASGRGHIRFDYCLSNYRCPFKIFRLKRQAKPEAVPLNYKGGEALYPQLAVAKTVTLGLRGEYFQTRWWYRFVMAILNG